MLVAPVILGSKDIIGDQAKILFVQMFLDTIHSQSPIQKVQMRYREKQVNFSYSVFIFRKYQLHIRVYTCYTWNYIYRYYILRLKYGDPICINK